MLLAGTTEARVDLTEVDLSGDNCNEISGEIGTCMKR